MNPPSSLSRSAPDGQRASAIAAAWLGLRDALSWRALAHMLALWLFAFAACAMLFWLCREQIERLAMHIGVPVVMLAASLGAFGAKGAGVAAGGVGAVTALGAALAASIAAAVLWYALSVYLVARLILEFMLAGRVRAQVVRRYPALRFDGDEAPQAAQALRIRAGPVLATVLGIPLLILLPWVGGVAAFVLGSYLNVRTLVGDAFGNSASPQRVRQFIQRKRAALVLLGVIMALATMLPLVGFLAPWAMAAAVCHLVFRDAAQQAGAAANALGVRNTA